jgi:hypothetical protein
MQNFPRADWSRITSYVAIVAVFSRRVDVAESGFNQKDLIILRRISKYTYQYFLQGL